MPMEMSRNQSMPMEMSPGTWGGGIERTTFIHPHRFVMGCSNTLNKEMIFLCKVQKNSRDTAW